MKHYSSYGFNICMQSMAVGADGENILLVPKAVELASKREHELVLIHLLMEEEKCALDHHLSYKIVTLRHVKVRMNSSKI